MNQEKNDIILTCIKPICLNSYRNTKLPDRTRTATFITLAQISFSWAFSKASAGYSFDFVQCKQMPTQAEYFLFLTAFARQTKLQELLKREKNMNYKVISVSSAHQMWKNLYSIFSDSVHSHSNVGASSDQHKLSALSNPLVPSAATVVLFSW